MTRAVLLAVIVAAIVAGILGGIAIVDALSG